MKRGNPLFGSVPLVILIAAIGGAGALGLVESHGTAASSPPSVAEVLAATASERTARYNAVSITTSPNPDLRGRISTSGSVVFATGYGTSLTTIHNIEYQSSDGGPYTRHATTFSMEVRTVAGHEYVRIPGNVWGEMSQSRPLPTGVVGGLGSRYVGLLATPSRDVRLVEVASGTVGGTHVTAYRVEAVGPTSRCFASREGEFHFSTEVWLDARDRIREVRTDSSGSIPAAPGVAGKHFIGRVTTFTDLRITGYGSPILVAPPPRAVYGAGSVIEASATCRPAHPKH